MSLTCDGAGLLWPNVAWRLALLAPNLTPGDIVSHVNVRTAAANFDAGSRPSTIKELQLWKLQSGPVGVGGRAVTCSPTPTVHGGESGRVVRDERGGGGGGEGGAGRPGLT
jgi:hypothetical protein